MREEEEEEEEEEAEEEDDDRRRIMLPRALYCTILFCLPLVRRYTKMCFFKYKHE